MEIVREREHVEPRPYYLREFRWKDSPNAGFSFDLADPESPTSAPAPPKNEDAARHLRECLDGTNAVDDHGNVRYQQRAYTVPAVGRCDCGQEVELDGFTNTCACGADYSSSGDRLAPRDAWGEETGEAVSDILRIR